MKRLLRGFIAGLFVLLLFFSFATVLIRVRSNWIADAIDWNGWRIDPPAKPQAVANARENTGFLRT